ncbi:MAG TPA: aconitase X catalytic domain-containing protein [Anaerolineae bacterium]|nr:aconitase X catalytic domain-containing protein [Anaerolineae bacterium]
MRLSGEERAMLSGDHGPAAQKAMEIVVALAEIYEAEDLVPVASVQVAGVSYGNLGQAGLDFLEEWAADGARVVVPTTLNPAGMDLEAWRQLGIPKEYAQRQLEVIEAYRAMGITISCSCTPYLAGNTPGLGQHIAWSESSAVSYANSVLGARTNREGGPSALAAAITGRTARYGLHLDDNRQAHLVVEVACDLHSQADFSALGYLVGQRAGGSVPYFRLKSGLEPGLDELKSLGAAMAASGAVALYHVEGVTPEARSRTMVADDATTFSIESLDEGYEILNGAGQKIDLVWLGCPHASLAEIERIADQLGGRQVEAALWITTAREVLRAARSRGLTDRIEGCGGRVVADACLIGAPLGDMGISSVATNSSKGAFYLRNHSHLQVRFGTLAQCVEAAVKGRWPA